MATQAKVVAEMDLSLIGSDVADLLLIAGGGTGGNYGAGGAGGFITSKIKLVSGSHTVTIGGSDSNSYFDGPSGCFIAYRGGRGYDTTNQIASADFSVGSSGSGSHNGGVSSAHTWMSTFFIGAHLGQGHPGYNYNNGGFGGGAGGEGNNQYSGAGRKWIDGNTYAAGGHNHGTGIANSGNGGGRSSSLSGESGICAIAYVGTTNKFTGGSVSQVGALRIHYFTASTTFTI